MTTRDEEAQQVMDEAAAVANRWSVENQMVGGACDFCSRLLAGKPVVTYRLDSPIVDQVVGVSEDGGVGTMTHVMDEDWAACPACDPVVAAGDPVALARHAFDTRDRKRLPGLDSDRSTEMVRLTWLYRQFYARHPERLV